MVKIRARYAINTKSATGYENTEHIIKIMGDKIVKIVVFAPESHADAVRKAMGQAGAGKIGNYSFCSFSVKGIGRFKPGKGAHPAIGKVGKIEEVVEERIEAVCEKGKLKKVISAIKKVHPYEEIALDIYPLYEHK